VRSLPGRQDALQVYVEHRDGASDVATHIGGTPIRGPAMRTFTWAVRGRMVGTELVERDPADGGASVRWYPLLVDPRAGVPS
jgi:hypothetical protein